MNGGKKSGISWGLRWNQNVNFGERGGKKLIAFR
jgi:hypothetical protein